jgi:hypothetical protein
MEEINLTQIDVMEDWKGYCRTGGCVAIKKLYIKIKGEVLSPIIFF